jgi:SAM domain (Sterile alpha motif)
MDVGSWLRSLGLGEYEPAFRDNQNDGEVLPNLTGDDLKELGVVPLDIGGSCWRPLRSFRGGLPS